MSAIDEIFSGTEVRGEDSGSAVATGFLVAVGSSSVAVSD